MAAAVLELTTAEALGLRMTSLLLRGDRDPDSAARPADVAEVVTWFGAMQSQDLVSGLWSLGVRLPEMTVGDVEAAMERREALRTWPMRGTVHLVPPQDAHWMLEVMGERPLAGAAKRREYLGLAEADAEQAVEVLAAALAGGGRLTRAQCVEALEATGIDGAGQRAYHLLWFASQRGVTCIAPNVDGEQTFVLLDEWVKTSRRLDRDEALATMAERYFRSHGPTTRQDFAGWTGLTAADAKAGIAGCGDALESVRVNGKTMLAARELLEVSDVGSGASAEVDGDEVLALPGFDEYLLGYKDRSMMVDAAHMEAIIPGKNGVFRSTIVRAGQVIGTWKRTLGKERVSVEVWPVGRLRASDRRQVEAALAPYATFVGRDLDVRWP